MAAPDARPTDHATHRCDDCKAADATIELDLPTISRGRHVRPPTINLRLCPQCLAETVANGRGIRARYDAV